jgi:hypothetical protein
MLSPRVMLRHTDQLELTIRETCVGTMPGQVIMHQKPFTL